MTHSSGPRLATAIVVRKAHQLGHQRNAGKALGDH